MNRPSNNEPNQTPWANWMISWVTGVMIFLIAAGSFVLSYSNLHETAIIYGLPPRLAWIWPLLVDFALVVFSLAVVRAGLYNERTWWPWTLVALYTVATVSFNVAHAPANLQARIVAAIAPISLFLSFELLMGQVKNGVIRQGLQIGLAGLKRELERIGVEIGLGKDELEQVHGELMQARSSLDSTREEQGRLSELMTRLDQEVSELKSKAAELSSQVERLTAQKAELKNELKRDEPKRVEPAKVSPENKPELSERQRQILELLGRGLTQEATAGELGVHVSTVKRELAKLNGAAEGAR